MKRRFKPSHPLFNPCEPLPLPCHKLTSVNDPLQNTISWKHDVIIILSELSISMYISRNRKKRSLYNILPASKYDNHFLLILFYTLLSYYNHMDIVQKQNWDARGGFTILKSIIIKDTCGVVCSPLTNHPD